MGCGQSNKAKNRPLGNQGARPDSKPLGAEEGRVFMMCRGLDAALVTACSGDPVPLLELGKEVLQQLGGSLRTYRETYAL